MDAAAGIETHAPFEGRWQMKNLNWTDICFNLVLKEHGGCDQSTCTIAVALKHGLHSLAIQSFVDSGAASDQLLDAFTNVGPSFQKQVNRELKALWKLPTHRCDCNAYIYEPEECDYFCDSCGKKSERGEV
jgi:hypothetical protein